MTGIRHDFNGQYLIFNEFIKVTGTFVVSQLPDRPCAMARLKAFSSNAGSMFFGSVYNTGSVLSLPFEFDAGDDSGWFSIDNLNRLYQGGSSGSSYMGVWLQK